MSNGFPIDIDSLGGAPTPQRVVLAIGSNLGERLDTIQGALNRLAETPGLKLERVSSVYETEPVGPVTDQPEFLNLVLLATTTLSPLMLLERCLTIEDAYDRVRDVRMGPRTLDIDVVKVGELTSDDEDLILPHPRAHERAFVLIPWLEVEPDAKLGDQAVADLVETVDSAGVRRSSLRVDLS